MTPQPTTAFPSPIALDAMPSFSDYEADAVGRGFDEVMERVWTPGTHVHTHGHPFAVEALMVDGELTLTIGDETRVLHRGDRFTLTHDQPHEELYGGEGAVYWVARRHAAD
ncbi:cupin domain-containing protein [Pseudacidovorax sp. RU35E]|uniref:cupin domain-containing protein n=1 Tax=Pseudacidovorax sp. RU35E TaxID=1907403 RepID=UPI000953FFAB|nr:AraC family transcriptional regulator [Pseudacidovorax sp. RU35E]SIQ31833.1 hypothetical protein SAMN05880557_10379 [Pseudacidovorax sp. RU35E]